MPSSVLSKILAAGSVASGGTLFLATPAAGKLWRVRWVCVWFNDSGAGPHRYILIHDFSGGGGIAAGGSGIGAFGIDRYLSEFVVVHGDDLKFQPNGGGDGWVYLAGSERTL